MEDQLNKFIQDTKGKSNLGDTPQNKGQCVGLIELWIDTLGLTHDWGNAIDLLKDADLNSFEVVYNRLGDTSQFPPVGAIAVLGKPFGLLSDGTYAGHTGVVLSGTDGNVLKLWQQNDPEGSKPQEKDYTYDYCVGWLIPKVSSTPGLPANYDDIVHGSTQWDQTISTYLPGNDPKHTDFSQLQTVIAGIKSTATASNNKVAQDTITIAGLNTQIHNYGEKLALADTQRQQDAEAYLSQIDALKTASATNEKMVGSFQGQIRVLQEQVKKALDDKHTIAVELAQCQAGTQQSLWDKILSLFKRG